VDLGQRLLRAFLETLVQLTVEGHRSHVAEVVVGAAPAELAELVLHVPGILRSEVLDRVHDPLALLLEQRPELSRVDCRHGMILPRALAAEASRRSISSAPIPASETTLSRAACPETSLTSRW